MTRICLTLAVILVFGACGGSDSGGASDSGQSAGSGQADSASGSGAGDSGSTDGGAGVTASDSEDVKACLSLVKQGEFQQAITPCTQAVRNYPANEELQAALDEAKKGAAAAMVDSEAVADDAKAKLGEAAGGLKIP